MPKPKREWPDGEERHVDGSIVTHSAQRGCSLIISVNELPKEVYALMQIANPEEMLILHHHADPEVEVYVRNSDISSIDARWRRVGD